MLIKGVDISFIKRILITSLLLLGISYFPVTKILTELQIYSLIYGYLIGLVYILVGWVFIEISSDMTFKRFMIILFGGMFLRIIVTVILIIVLVWYSRVDVTVLVFSFMFFYFLFTGMEIYYIQKLKMTRESKVIEGS